MPGNTQIIGIVAIERVRDQLPAPERDRPGRRKRAGLLPRALWPASRAYSASPALTAREGAAVNHAQTQMNATKIATDATQGCCSLCDARISRTS